jgi:DNA-binding response OmpR family regulator
LPIAGEKKNRPSEGVKFLAVEDDAARTVLRQALRKLGHDVIEVTNGRKARTIMEVEPVRVIGSDGMMPNLNGFDRCRKMRERPDADYVYLVLLTAILADSANHIEAADAGVDDFLSKPLKWKELWLRRRVAERILRYAPQVRPLEERLPICSSCKKSPTIKNIGSTWRSASTSARAANSVARWARTASCWSCSLSSRN